MEFLRFTLLEAWRWVADSGFAIAALLILLILVPRIRRVVLVLTAGNIDDSEENAKGRRALIGAVVYIVEVIAYFILILALISKFGISLTAAAIPATVISAAIGFGAQGVIGDLLGGVFIIAEKQYGIGDWVEFHSPSGTVQGDVVNMTLRATTIRTLNGEEIIVPNSEARMCINYSSQWSRAVVDVPVPMTAGGSIRDLEERTLAAAKRAVSLEKIEKSVLSDVTLQSSTALNAPTAMGLPWTVNMRVLVDCAPGDQWLIERAIRAAIIDTWWDDYGERASATGLSAAEEITGHARDDVMLDQLAATDAASRPTAAWSNTSDAAATGTAQAHETGVAAASDTDGTETVAGAAAATAAEPPTQVLSSDGEVTDTRELDPNQVAAASGSAGVAGAVAGAAAGAVAGADADSPAAAQTAPVKNANARTDMPTHRSQEEAAKNLTAEADEESPKQPKVDWSALSNRERLRVILSAGGRARVSTVILIICFFILGALNFATSENQDGPSGWLAPSRWSERTEQTDTDGATDSGAAQGGTSTTNSTSTQQRPTSETAPQTTSEPTATTTPRQSAERTAQTTQPSQSSSATSQSSSATSSTPTQSATSSTSEPVSPTQ